MSRHKRDKKYGFGGQKKRSKRNDKERYRLVIYVSPNAFLASRTSFEAVVRKAVSVEAVGSRRDDKRITLVTLLQLVATFLLRLLNFELNAVVRTTF